METRFYFDSSVASTISVGMGPGFLLMAAGAIGIDSVFRLVLSLVVGIGISFLLRFGITRGTYTTIKDNKEMYGTSFFITRKKPIYISDIISIEPRKEFVGLFTAVYMRCREKDGTLLDRSIASKESLKPEVFKKLINTIIAANPKIEVSKDLLS